jgi:hypothetical protein
VFLSWGRAASGDSVKDVVAVKRRHPRREVAFDGADAGEVADLDEDGTD